MSTPSIAVVIPTYNRLELLRQTLRSVAAQDLHPDHVVVVDDGSDDGTAAWLATQDGLTVVRNEGGGWGPARGRQEGAGAVDSDLIAFLDSDDLLLPSALSSLAAALVEHPGSPFAFGRTLVALREPEGWHPSGLITPDAAELRDPLPSLFARNFVSSVGTTLHRSALEELGGYPVDVTFAEDHYLWIRLAQLGEPTFVPKLTAVYREHGGGRHSPERAERETAAFLALADGDPRLNPARPERIGVQLLENATYHLHDDPRSAVTVTRAALKGNPHKLTTVRTAARYWRGRRRRDAAGQALWESDANLRAWLAEY